MFGDYTTAKGKLHLLHCQRSTTASVSSTQTNNGSLNSYTMSGEDGAASRGFFFLCIKAMLGKRSHFSVAWLAETPTLSMEKRPLSTLIKIKNRL